MLKKWRRVSILFIIAMALGQWSCLQFVPIEQAQEVNNPPRILSTGVVPRESVITIRKTQDPNGTSSFKLLFIQDVDLKDTIYVYWFLDFHRFPQGSVRCAQTPNVPAQNSNDGADGLRQVEFHCEIAHEDLSLQPGKASLLELFVVDRAPIGQVPESDGVRRWAENAEWDKWSWMLQVE